MSLWRNRVHVQLAVWFAVGASSCKVSGIDLVRTEIPHLRQVVPLAISTDGSFAIVSSEEHRLVRLNLSDGTMTDIGVKSPARHSHLRLFPHSQRIAYFDEPTHSLVSVATVPPFRRNTFELPESTFGLNLKRLNVFPKKRGATDPQQRELTLRGSTATGLWISETEDTVAICLAGELVLVDVPSKVTTVIPPVIIGGSYHDVAFSSDATAIIVSAPLGSRRLAIVDLTSHDRIFDFEEFRIERHRVPKTGQSFFRYNRHQCREIAWARDDSVVAGVVGIGRPDVLYLWNGATGRILNKWDSGTVIKTLELTADSRHCLAVTSGIDRNEVVLVNVENGKSLATMQLPKMSPNSPFLGLGLKTQRTGHGKIYFYDGADVAFSVGADIPN